MTHYDDIQRLRSAYTDALHEQSAAAVLFADCIIDELPGFDQHCRDYIAARNESEMRWRQYTDAVRAFKEKSLGETP